jgi:DHA1 family tetracycline resistance protein-like MFS transporter
MLRQVPKNKLLPIFSITLLDEIVLNIGTPVLIFLCFDANSKLFAANVDHVSRSFWFGICAAAPSLIAIVTAPLLGFVSDQWGRKPILVIGTIGALLLCVFTTLSIVYSTVILLVIGFVVAGFCARTQPVALAVVGDLSPPNRKIINMGYLQLSISIGASVGPLLGGYFAQRYFFKTLNFSMPYLIGMLITFFTVIVTVKYFRESYKPLRNAIGKTNWRQLINPTVMRISIILILTQVSWRIYYQFIPPILKINFHYSATIVGMFLAITAIWLALAAAFGVRWLSNYFTIVKLIKYLCYSELAGLLLAISGCIFNLGWLSQLLIWLSVIPVAISDVIIFCAISTLYSQAVSAQDQGKIMGFCFVIVSAVWALTGFCGGLLAGVSVILPILCAPISLVILLCSRKTFY